MAIFPAVFDLSTLDGVNGFRLDGVDAGDFSGFSVSSAGDVNGDGFDDIIIGAFGAGANGGANSGKSYVVFGKVSGFVTSLDLSNLDGTNGFRLDGIDAGDISGFSVSSAGDVNGDGFDDIIVGAYGADANGAENSGESYVVFGKPTGFASSFNLANLDGSNGFRLNGVEELDHSGFSVSSAGDVNGDGFADIIIGAPSFAGTVGYSSPGNSYVVFGKLNGFSSSLELSSLDGGNGFRLEGIDHYDYNGHSVSSAGDINGDGFDDIIIGAYGADPGGNSWAGESYVVFGKASGFDASFSLSSFDGSNGFRLDGIDAADQSGISVNTAGDVNGDGFDDIIIGAYGADANGAGNSGESYVVFGKPIGFASNFNLSNLDGSNGFSLIGIDAGDLSGISVGSVGDFNGDGFDDIIIGAPGTDTSAGESFVVFVKATGFTASFDLSSLDGNNGFRFSGIVNGDHSGDPVSSAGDVNGDGFDDIIIGAISANPNGNSNAGETYVIFGGPSQQTNLQTGEQIWSNEHTVHFANFADAAYGAAAGSDARNFLTNAGWRIFSLTTEADFFNLSEVDGGSFDGGYTFNNDGTIASEGTFGLLGNSALMLARSQDALVISFRGTDDWQDAVDWGHLSSHFAELEPLLERINQFVANSSEINKVYVTGHSLGAAMAQQYYVKYSQAGFADITGVNFASPGYEDSVFNALGNLVLGGGVFTSMIDLLQYYGADFDTYWNDGDIIQNGAAIQSTIGQKHLIKFSTNSNLGSFFGSTFTKHSMELYREAVNFIAQQWTQSDASLLMTVDEMLDAYEGYYIQADYDGTQKSWMVGNRVGFDTFYGDWELFSNPDEAFFGSGANDIIKGKDGNDLLHGGGGSDLLFGGDDSDIIIGGSGIDTVTYQSGVLVVTVNLQTGRGFGGEAAGDRIYEVENVIGTGLGGLLFGDTLWGDNENNVIDGLGGKDNLKGFGGNDTLFGRTGNDKLEGGIGADILDGGAGHDTILYTNSTAGVNIDLTGNTPSTGGEAEGDNLVSIEHVEGSGYDDVLVGSFTTANHLFGYAGDDFLSGLSGNDRLYGGAGQDRLFAGDGYDILKGGIDADHFVFDNDDDLNFIRDFQRPIDKIQILDGVSFDGAVAEWKLWGGTKIELGVDDIYISTKLWGTKITYGDTTISLTGVYGTIDETHFIPDDMGGAGL